LFTLNYFIDEFFLKKKALIPLALEGSEVGKAKAAQALAKITISINPELAFPGQRVRNTHI
jgi:hypothetical protein